MSIMASTNNKVHGKINSMQIFMISAWGFTMVISSFLFLLVGHWIDLKFNTEPKFMTGLLALAVFLCIWRLYEEATRKSKRC
ncbi:MAG TPA: AtpZ/AtpI family protein [Deltaproteobacteria bacterium]|nr:MAG: hypothetical protein DRG37_03415 [Deltaproteobacteria bacterium]HDM32197.1 AtpZ/AtpI family protein [Deltaproteobacteria bacterium]